MNVNLMVMKIRMFISSYLPLYIMIIILNASDYRVTFKLGEMDKKVTIAFLILAILIIISIICSFDLVTTKAEGIYNFNKIEKTGDAIISYIMTYIVPLLSDNFLSPKVLFVNVVLYLMVGVMYVRLNLVYFNPFWVLLGYSVYNDENGAVIITNIPYERIKQKENRLKGSFIVKDVYLVRKKDNL